MIEHGSDGAVHFSAPLQKVDKENRLVSGFASLDNKDRQGDIVTSEAALAAFSNFRMNLREMHNNIAVGKVVDFKPDQFYDATTDKTYNGVYVTAYVSKGAQDTWEKVCDGTLTGFSIGGKAKSMEKVMVDGEMCRVVSEMELYELSLVDSPANQLANIITIQKNDGAQDTATGIVADTNIKDVFYCKGCEVLAHGNDSKSCAVCGNSMKAIGWVEDTGEKAVFESMKKVLGEYIEKACKTKKDMTMEDDTIEEKADKTPYGDVHYADPGYQKDGQKRYPIDTEVHVRAAWAYINQSDNASEYTSEQLNNIKGRIKAAAKKFNIEISDAATTKSISSGLNDQDKADDSLLKNKGGNNMAEEVTESIVEDASDIEKSVVAAEVSEVTELVTDELIEKAATNVEDEGVEVEVGEANLAMSESQEESSEVIKTLITDALESFAAQQTEAVTKAIADVIAATEAKIEGLKEEISSLNKSLEDRVEQVEGATAIKKSGELGGSAVQSKEIKKGVWNGAFAPQQFFDSNSIVE